MNTDPTHQPMSNQPGSQPSPVTGLSFQQEMAFRDMFVRVQMAVHQNAINKGWWEKRNKLLELAKASGADMAQFADDLILSQCILLEHSELSEGVEGMRGKLMDDKCPEFPMVVVEHADMIIRAFDAAERYKWDLIGAIFAKMRMNSTRAQMHGGKAF